MDRQLHACAEGSAQTSFWNHPLWLLLLLGLVAWQGWMTLTLFGSDHPWERMIDDQPIVSGSHALHLYFGYLGAQTLYERGSLCCYDPAFQAGYPKTPVFDSGSRPAELFLAVAGGGYKPSAYKIGLALCCCLVPVVLAVAARAVDLGRAASCLAASLGLLIWWGAPGREMLEAGDLDLLLASLASLTFVTLLVRFDRAPNFRGWLGLLASGWIGCFTQPFVFVLVLPLLLIYYLSVGARHRLPWHLALAGALTGALAGNSFWLSDWVLSWWIRKPLQIGSDALIHRTFHTLWNASLWGDAADRSLAVAIIGAAALGVLLLNQSRQRAAARLLGLGAGGFLILAVSGVAWKSLGRLGTSQLLIPALWFAVLPAVYALVRLVRLARHMVRTPRGQALLGGGLLVPGLIACWPVLTPLLMRCLGTTPLEIGLGPDREALVEALRNETSAGARILFEDRPGRREGSRWTVLLPYLTDRVYLGGLDPEGWIEHSFARLAGQNLAGRPIAEWTDAELEDFCRRYNVGWAVCWSPAAVARLQAWPGTKRKVPVIDEGPGWFFTFQPHSFVLKGQAEVVCVNRERIALANVVPDNGIVVLSQHFQSGMQATPSRVQVERDQDPYDPIPFIRLRVPGPVACVTLTYEDP